MRINLCRVRPPGYPHAAILDDSAELMRHALTDLGHKVEENSNKLEAGALNVLVGYHLLDGPPSGDYVVWQLEQLPSDEGERGWWGPKLEAVLRKAAAVWDYTAGNVAFLAEHGIKAELMPYGYHPALERDVRPLELDDGERLEVLLAGSMNERRRAQLEAIGEHCRAAHMFGQYGRARDQMFATAQINLNAHFYAAKFCEQMRLSYFLNNGWFCVTEDSSDDPYGEVIPHAPGGQPLVELCLEWLERGPAARRERADAAREWFKARPMAANVQAVLDA